MVIRTRRFRLAVMLAALALVATTSVGTVLGRSEESSRAQLDHVFVIMLENHSQSTVIGDPNAPYISSLATTYGLAANYYGVTHPSMPNYVAAISGSNWFINDDNPANRFDHTNLVDQLESSNHSWAAYMETMPSAGYLGDQYPANAALYVSKHNPFVLFDSVRNDPARLAKIKPYTSFATDLASGKVANFVWISPNQCHDMHGGVYPDKNGNVTPEVAAAGGPCPYGSAVDDTNDASLKSKADTFVKGAVDAIMASKAWTGNSAIFIMTDENDYTGNTSTDGWESAAGCCDSPILPDGYQFLSSHGTPDGNVWHGQNGNFQYGGGLIPAIVIARHGVRGYVSNVAYNHYSLLRTIEENWHLGYLGNASDSSQVSSMSEFFVH